MERSSLLAASYALDWLIGDPEWMPHPVRGMGWAIATGERVLRKSGSGKRWELATGGLLAATVPLVAAYTAKDIIRAAYTRQHVLGLIFEAWLAAACLATRNLLDEAAQVIRAIDEGDVAAARRRLARIVGRDAQSLDEREICRAVIETLAESFSDGIIAPLFYLSLGGVPAGIAYKAVNTLDSMIGHLDLKYRWFGRVAARLDDAANWIPARISAILICIAAKMVCGRGSGLRAVRIWLRDGSHHASPNAGQVESAMAGAVAARLGGSNRYDGERVESPLLGAEFQQPNRSAAVSALRVVAVASLLGVAAAWLSTRSNRHGG
ncbi:MAG TPA: adenosylcobinamide-phosphate synthase CbiB [Terracidiphilus sp.]|nr:adenosylcobinamide-phosphate synthase CbiB [Terracidiphilus sp.]